MNKLTPMISVVLFAAVAGLPAPTWAGSWHSRQIQNQQRPLRLTASQKTYLRFRFNETLTRIRADRAARQSASQRAALSKRFPISQADLRSGRVGRRVSNAPARSRLRGSGLTLKVQQQRLKPTPTRRWQSPRPGPAGRGAMGVSHFRRPWRR